MTNSDYIALSESLMTEMESHKNEWDWLRNHIMPRTGDPLDEHPSVPRKRMHSTTACDSLHALAGAHVMYITPAGERWFTLDSRLVGDEKRAIYDTWFDKCTEVTHGELSRSNFYTIIHECFIDRCLTGTGCVFADALKDGGLNFTHVPTGTYAIADGFNGQVDTIVRKFKLTAHQAYERWGNKLPERMMDAYDNPKRSMKDKFEFLHLVTPRKKAARGKVLVQPKHMPFASVYISIGTGDKDVIEVSGYQEFPFLVTRFLRFGASPYGYAPGLNVWEEIESVLRLERVLDVLGETAAFPRILELADQVGEIDLRAGGRTVIKPQAAQLNLPRTWATEGRYDIGKDRIDDKEKKIEAAFYKPMLQVVSSVDRMMTATEVNARQEEKILAFNPSLTLFISDCNVLIARIFSLLYRLGRYPSKDMPPELAVAFSDGTESNKKQIPSVSYNGKIGQAIERAQRNGADYYLTVALQYTQASGGDTSMMDIIDMSKYAKFCYRGSGAPTECLRTDADIAALQQQRQAAMQQQQELANTQQLAATGKDVASAENLRTKKQ